VRECGRERERMRDNMTPCDHAHALCVEGNERGCECVGAACVGMLL